MCQRHTSTVNEVHQTAKTRRRCNKASRGVPLPRLPAPSPCRRKAAGTHFGSDAPAASGGTVGSAGRPTGPRPPPTPTIGSARPWKWPASCGLLAIGRRRPEQPCEVSARDLRRNCRNCASLFRPTVYTPTLYAGREPALFLERLPICRPIALPTAAFITDNARLSRRISPVVSRITLLIANSWQRRSWMI